MEVLPENQSTSSSPGLVAAPGSPLTGSSMSPTPGPPATPEIMEIPIEDEDLQTEDDSKYENDPISCVLNLLNFTVIPKKPKNILETPAPYLPGDLITKSHYIEEKKAMYEIIQTQRKEVIKLQAEKINEMVKNQETDQKMQRVVRIVAELHSLYGQFVKSLVLLMRKSVSPQGNQVFLSIGPFSGTQEADSLLIALSSLSNHFQNDFENLSKTKKILTEVAGYFNEKVALILNSEEVLATTQEAPISTEGSTPVSYASVSEPPADMFPQTSDTNQSDIIEETPDPVASMTSSEVTAPCSSNSISPPPSSSSNESTTVPAFIPVPDQNKNQLADGRTLYSLVEYPKQLNLVNKKHCLDKSKGYGDKGWFCLCGQDFASLPLLKYHIRYFSAKWKFICTLCSSKFPGLNFLKLHMLRTHKIVYVGTNTCRYCPKSFQSATELLRHLKIVHNKKLPEEVDYLLSQPETGQSQDDSTSPISLQTESASTSSSSSSSTLPSTSGGSPKPSSVLVVSGSRCACGEELGSKEGLIAHIRKEVETHGQNFECSMCTEKFNHPCNLKCHFREKHGVEYQDYQDRQYGCSCCDKMFPCYEDLETHINTTHQMEQDEEGMVLENDPLRIDSLLENGAGEGETMTFHVDANDEMDSVSNEPALITLDDDD